jgi:hypothetical protein
MNKKYILFIVSLFLISSAYALGVTPARTTIDFEPGLTKTINFDIINSEGKDMRLVGSVVAGELDNYISLPLKEMFISAGEKSKTFSYNINLPESLSPGLHKGEILITELSEEMDLGVTQVLATLAVVTQLYIYVPYPGKYADAKMVVYNANQGEDVLFVFPVVSAGEFDLTSVKANVEIFNKMGEKIDNFTTSTINIPSREKKEIVYKWKAEVIIGEYLASASLIYDEGVINLEGFFSVGIKELELKEITAKGFRLGEIAKLEMLVENKWSEPISGFYIETKIKNDKGDIISSFQSPIQNIDALSKQLFASYWDTAGVRVGTYETEISINYADKSSKNNLKFKVDENELTIFGLGYVVSTDKKGSTDTLFVVLIIIIVFLILINLLWFFLLRKRIKK